MAFVEIENLTFKYKGAEAPALCGIDLTLERGRIGVLIGPSGCGKSTLLRMLKPQIRPRGTVFGRVSVNGSEWCRELSPGRIGYVAQSPADQTVTDTVAHELAFGLESEGKDPAFIRKRIAEVCGSFGIEGDCAGGIYGKNVSEISGGEIQYVELAAAAAGEPCLLLLDEPTSQLDPVAAEKLFSAIRRLNEETGVTVLMTEHRLENVLPMADKVFILGGNGKLVFDGSPEDAAAYLFSGDAPADVLPLAASMPAAAEIYSLLEMKNGKIAGENCPLTVREGREYIYENFRIDRASAALPAKKKKSAPWKDPAVSLNNICFRYGKDTPDVLYGLDLEIRYGEVLGIVGGNGSGKSTLLGVMAGLDRAYRGKRRVAGKIAMLPQDPRMLFDCDTLGEDLIEAAGTSISGDNGADAEGDKLIAEAVAATVKRFRLGKLLNRHPYDLSGGERQKAALAKLLLTGADILLLDEATSGLDAGARAMLGKLIRGLAASGAAVVVVTHDLNFAASYTDRCGMLFDGRIVSAAETGAFFSENVCYTTAAARIARPFFPGVVTVRDAVEMCLGSERIVKENDEHEDNDELIDEKDEKEEKGEKGEKGEKDEKDEVSETPDVHSEEDKKEETDKDYKDDKDDKDDKDPDDTDTAEEKVTDDENEDVEDNDGGCDDE